MRFGYCICYHRPRKVIRQRGFPCRGPLPALSSNILIFFLNIKWEMCCEVSHTPLLFIIYLFTSIKALCDALGTEIHVCIHSEPNGSNGQRPGSAACNTLSLRGLQLSPSRMEIPTYGPDFQPLLTRTR